MVQHARVHLRCRPAGGPLSCKIRPTVAFALALGRERTLVSSDRYTRPTKVHTADLHENRTNRATL